MLNGALHTAISYIWIPPQVQPSLSTQQRRQWSYSKGVLSTIPTDQVSSCLYYIHRLILTMFKLTDFTMLKLSGWEYHFAFMRYSDRWRFVWLYELQYARCLTFIFIESIAEYSTNTFSLVRFQITIPHKRRQTYVMLQQFLKSPDEFEHHVRQ